MTFRPQTLRLVALASMTSALCGLGAQCVTQPPAGTVVNVALREFTVTPDVASAPAGTLTFHATNTGEFTHELLVIKTDLAPDVLPTESDGRYQENGPGTEVMGETTELGPGESADLTLDLDAGKYVLICNMVDAEAHYALGMRTGFTVE